MEVSAGAVIKNKEGKFLVIQGKSGYWGFPKGHVEEGETLQQTAEREIMEEVGLSIKFINDDKFTYRYDMKNGDIKEETFFLASTDESDVKTNHEVIDHKWLDYKKALSILSFQDSKEAFKFLVKEP